MSQYITKQGLKNTLNNFIKRLKSWLPFKWGKSGVETLEIAGNDGEVAMGSYNKVDADSVFTIGTGTSSEMRASAVNVRKNGDIIILKDIDNDGVRDEVILQDMLDSCGEVESMTEEDINNIIGN